MNSVDELKQFLKPNKIKIIFFLIILIIVLIHIFLVGMNALAEPGYNLIYLPIFMGAYFLESFSFIYLFFCFAGFFIWYFFICFIFLIYDNIKKLIIK
jgi:hypothetical protein